MKIRVDAGGRAVEIETTNDANLAPDALARVAMDMWQKTAGAGERLGPPLGFAAQERAPIDGRARRWLGEGEPLPVHGRTETP